MPTGSSEFRRLSPAIVRPLWVALLAVAICSACGAGPTQPVVDPPDVCDTCGVTPPPEVRGSVLGTVRRAGSGQPIAGATVSIDGLQATTGADGSFAIHNILAGARTVRCVAPGYGPVETPVIVSAAAAVIDVPLSEQDVFELQIGNYVLFVPRTVSTVTAVLFALGGPDTRALADPGRSFNLEPFVPQELEGSLADLRARYQQLALERGLAILGIRTGANYELLPAALEEAAAMTGRFELPSAPLLLHGMSAGTLGATALAAQNATRTMGLVLRVPGEYAATQITPQSGSIPTLVMTGAEDAVVNNTVTRNAYQTVRGGGGLWAYADEPGIGHYELTLPARSLTIGWFEAVLDRRLPLVPGGPVRDVSEDSGWLGHPQNFSVWAWGAYPGEKRAASWFPTEPVTAHWVEVVQ